MSGLSPLPQTVLHSSKRLTHFEAHTLLSSFLTEAENNPALRPDSQITPHAIQSQTTGLNGNITLTHLDRILQGIAGKRVGGVEFSTGRNDSKKRRRMNGDVSSSPPVMATGHERVKEQEDEGGEGEAAVMGEETGAWQNKDDYEHAQVDETGDLPGRDPADPNEGDGDAGIEQKQMRDDMEVRSVNGQGLTPAEKEARKQAKKDRQKLEKRSVRNKKGSKSIT